ncbi:MAG: FMN-binding protein [Spirochaetes bacterium]|nr:FMN-binding protein [Spirochaetota bacterium]
MNNIVNRLLSASLLLLIIMSLSDCSGIKQNNERRRAEIIKIDLKNVRDGEYIGEYNVNINSAKVLVSVKKGTIQKIEILKHHHGPGYGADKLTEVIINKQTLEVDVLTGATKSSFVLKKAIQNALNYGL